MPRLYLVRHARTAIDPGRSSAEWGLDPAGKPLLDQLAALPHWATVSRIFSSSEPKAVQTGAAIAAAHRLPAVESRDALRELKKSGFVADHDAAMDAVFRFPDRPAVVGWETAAAAVSRVADAIDSLLAETKGQSIAVVSHGTVLALYVAHLQQRRQVNLTEWGAIGMPDFCVVDPATLQILQPFGAWLTRAG